MAENLFDEIEHAFTPKPGGIIDRHHKHAAQREAADAERQHIAEQVNQPAFKGVKTAPESPEKISFQTFFVQPNGVVQLMPYDPYRQRATVSITTPSAFGLLCRDQSAALSQTGFFHGVAQPPLVIMSRAQVWFVNTSSTASNVSVMLENYQPVNPGVNG